MTPAQTRAALAALCPRLGLSEVHNDAWTQPGSGRPCVSVVGSRIFVSIAHDAPSVQVTPEPATAAGIAHAIRWGLAQASERHHARMIGPLHDAAELTSRIDALSAEGLSSVVDAIGGAA